MKLESLDNMEADSDMDDPTRNAIAEDLRVKNLGRN
jgi:hypothetical protein